MCFFPRIILLQMQNEDVIVCLYSAALLLRVIGGDTDLLVQLDYGCVAEDIQFCAHCFHCRTSALYADRFDSNSAIED